MVELLNHVARLWWAWTASMFWQVGLLILVIAGIDLLIRKWAWPQLRYALWSLILVKLLLPPTLSLPSGVVPELRPRAAKVLEWMNSDLPAAGEKPAAISDCGFRIANSTFSVDPQFCTIAVANVGFQPPMADESATDASSALAANPQSEIISPQFEWPFYAMTIWLLGTLILGIWLCLRLHSVAGRQAYQAAAASLPQSFYNHLADGATRLGLRRIPRVAVTKRLTSPAVFGVLSPVLLVPKGYLSKLSRRDTEHMLLHELAHIKRGDLVMHSLYLLLQVVYWYNPLLWLARRHLHHLRELSCDGTVAELLRERTRAYRQTLLETARRLLTTSVEPGLGLLGLFEDSNYLLVRLHWLTKPTWRYSTMKRAVVATVAILMFACVLPMAQGQESASPEITKVSTTEAVPVRVEEDNQQAQDQVSRDIARLQTQLRQMMAQQQELQKQLKALAEQREQLRSERREATLPWPVKKAPAAAPDMTLPPGPPSEGENLNVDQREQLKRAQEQVRRMQDAVKRAAKDAERAQRDAERAQAESSRTVQIQKNQDWTQSMQAYGDQMKKWEQSDQMKKWHEDMAQWGQKMGRWGQEYGRQRAGESATDGEQPQMPPMPPMPAMPPLPPMAPAPAAAHVNANTNVDVQVDVVTPHAAPHALVPGAPVPPLSREKEDGREEAVSRSEQILDVQDGRLLEVTNEIGEINLRGGDGKAQVIAIVKAKADTKEEAQRIADQVKLVVTPADGGVRVSMTRPESEDRHNGRNYQVTLDVTVPRGARIKVSQAVGGIHLANLRGSVEASAKAGSVRATNVAGHVALNTEVGSVEFVAPQDFSAKVQAKANMGAIQSDLPLDVVRPRGTAMGSTASGTIGGGEGEVSLRTNVGSIRIRSQEGEPKRAVRSERLERSRAEPQAQTAAPAPKRTGRGILIDLPLA